MVGTQYLGTGASPLVFQSIWQAAQLVKSPDPGFKTVYDQWLAVFSKSYNDTIRPQYAIYLHVHGLTLYSHCQMCCFQNLQPWLGE